MVVMSTTETKSCQVWKRNRIRGGNIGVVDCVFKVQLHKNSVPNTLFVKALVSLNRKT